jgi:hypothetical protein
VCELKTIQEILSEKRKNPDKNPKLSGYELLKKYKGRNDIFITFTTINKVGINPQNDFNTPTAIYTYPLNQVWKIIEQKKSTLDLPFAGDRPYIQVLRHNGKNKYIHDLATKYGKAEFEKDMDKLREMFKGHVTKIEKMYVKEYNYYKTDMMDTLDYIKNKINNEVVDNVEQMWKLYYKLKAEWDKIKNVELTTDKDQLVELGDAWLQIELIANDIGNLNNDMKPIINGSLSNAYYGGQNIVKRLSTGDNFPTIERSIERGAELAHDNSWGAKLWNVTRWASTNHFDPGMRTSKSSVTRWNKILRELGYAGMADRSGRGIIHTNERTQAIFLSTMYIDHIETIHNIRPSDPAKVKEIKNIEDLFDGVWDTRVKYSLTDIMGIINNKSSATDIKVSNPKSLIVPLVDYLVKNKDKLKFGYNTLPLVAFIGYLNLGKKFGRFFIEDLMSELAKKKDLIPAQDWSEQYYRLALGDFKKMGFNQNPRNWDRIIYNIAKTAKVSTKNYPKRGKTVSERMEWLLREKGLIQ